MFYRIDEHYVIDNETPRDDKPVRKDRLLMLIVREKEENPVKRAERILADAGIYRLHDNKIAVPYDFVHPDVEEALNSFNERPGLPSIFSKKNGKNTPILWEG